MARKVILDVDPGVADAMGLCLALSEPQLDVLAVTATGGNVLPEQSTRNVQAVVEQLDPARWPRIGAASTDQILRTDGRHLFGMDGFCGVTFNVAELHHRHPSSKVICDEVRTAPQEITLVSMGPLSNIAASLQREPDLAAQIGHLIILGGTLDGPGDITPAAEFNIYCDAESARSVFRSAVTKTLLPIDITERIVLEFGMLEKLPANQTRTGRLLRGILPGAFRTHRQLMGIEGMYIPDVVAVVAAMHPELFTTVPMYGDVEIEGELTHGATVLDRRTHPEDQPNMEVVVDVDTNGVLDCILGGLARAA